MPGDLNATGHPAADDLHSSDAATLRADEPTGAELARRRRARPGLGDPTTKIVVARRAKRVRPDGWERAAGVSSATTPRPIAEVHGPASPAVGREWKRAQHAAEKDQQDRPL